MSKPSLVSNTLIVNGATKNPYCYNSFNNAETVMELLTKHEGHLNNITVCYDTSDSAAVDKLIQYFLLRSKLGIKYPVKEIWLETKNENAWATVGEPLKKAGYGISLHEQK